MKRVDQGRLDNLIPLHDARVKVSTVFLSLDAARPERTARPGDADLQVQYTRAGCG